MCGFPKRLIAAESKPQAEDRKLTEEPHTADMSISYVFVKLYKVNVTNTFKTQVSALLQNQTEPWQH